MALADDVVDEYRALGIELDWPAGADREASLSRDDYPIEAWEEAPAGSLPPSSDTPPTVVAPR